MLKTFIFEISYKNKQNDSCNLFESPADWELLLNMYSANKTKCSICHETNYFLIIK